MSNIRHDRSNFDVYDPCILRFDSYRQLFDCSHPTVWNEVMTTYHSYHAHANPIEHLYIPGISDFSLFCFKLNSYDIQNSKEAPLIHGDPLRQVYSTVIYLMGWRRTQIVDSRIWVLSSFNRTQFSIRLQLATLG